MPDVRQDGTEKTQDESLHPSPAKHRTEKDQRMYATGDSNCPVASLKLYLQKLDDKSDYFLQGISPKAGKWYNGRKMGINNVNDFMKISNEAKLSHVYTNHSIRATAATVLANNGIELNDILAITGHKDTKSLLPYTEKCRTPNDAR